MTGPEDSSAHGRGPGRALAGAESRPTNPFNRPWQKKGRGLGAEAPGLRPMFLPRPICWPALHAGQCAPGTRPCAGDSSGPVIPVLGCQQPTVVLGRYRPNNDPIIRTALQPCPNRSQSCQTNQYRTGNGLDNPPLEAALTTRWSSFQGSGAGLAVAALAAALGGGGGGSAATRTARPEEAGWQGPAES